MRYLREMYASQPSRLSRLDALRGVAMVWMTIYHFCFDLNHFGWISQDFYRDPLWTSQRTAIVSLFLFCVGWSQSVTASDSTRSALYFSWKRWLQIAACAVAVSLSSYWMYPRSYIYFGVLHAVCIMLLVLWMLRFCLHRLGLFGIRSSSLYLAVGAVCLVLFAFPPVVMNDAPWNVLGLISVKPITEDYVPLLPWFALVCFGFAFGQLQRGEKKGFNAALNPWPIERLSQLGRYSLPYYMLHQPVLIGLLYLLNFGRLA